MLAEVFQNVLKVLGILICIPGILIIVLSSINHSSKQLIVNKWGTNFQIYFGFLGIIIHELSHLVVAILFGHKINSFKLIKRPNESSQSLGYVNHTWNNANFYQRVGNLFIGIAPIFGCSAVIIGLTHWLIPQVYSELITLAVSPASFTPFIPTNLSVVHTAIFVILIANICFGGFDLSRADFSNSNQGFWVTIIAVIIITVILSLTPWQTVIFGRLQIFITILGILLLFNIVVSVIFNVILRII